MCTLIGQLSTQGFYRLNRFPEVHEIKNRNPYNIQMRFNGVDIVNVVEDGCDEDENPVIPFVAPAESPKFIGAFNVNPVDIASKALLRRQPQPVQDIFDRYVSDDLPKAVNQIEAPTKEADYLKFFDQEIENDENIIEETALQAPINTISYENLERFLKSLSDDFAEKDLSSNETHETSPPQFIKPTINRSLKRIRGNYVTNILDKIITRPVMSSMPDASLQSDQKENIPSNQPRKQEKKIQFKEQVLMTSNTNQRPPAPVKTRPKMLSNKTLAGLDKLTDMFKLDLTKKPRMSSSNRDQPYHSVANTSSVGNNKLQLKAAIDLPTSSTNVDSRKEKLKEEFQIHQNISAYLNGLYELNLWINFLCPIERK